MGAPLNNDLACEGASYKRKLVEGGGPMGGFLYEANEWRTIYRWENIWWMRWRNNDTTEVQSIEPR